jgi:hypothetical protein
MRKFALLLAAAMVVSVPLAATVSTDSFAAAKKATKKAAPRAGGGGAAEIDPGEANSRFAHALGDLAMALGTYIYVPPGADGGKGRSGGGKKSKKG